MKFIPAGVAQLAGRTSLKLSASSPSLLFGGGVVAMVGSTVLACRATLKVEEVLDSVQEDLSKVKAAKDLPLAEPNVYTDGDARKDTAVIYARATLKLAKLYAPAIIAGSVGVACLTKSHNLLRERNTALMAAYTAVDKAFEKYRERVVAKHGEEEDRFFRYGGEEIKVVDGDTGKVVTKVLVDENEPSQYARFFDQLSTSWCKEPEYNLVFLRSQQNYANDLLKARGHVFLNEIYDLIGIERTSAGSVVGWVISEDGDNYIDFGMYDGDSKKRDFINGREGSILLDFNVDGMIYDKIESSKRGAGKPWQS